MDTTTLNTRLSFRAHFIRMHGPESDPLIRVLLVEANTSERVYEQIGTWKQCRCWVAHISGYAILPDQLVAVQKRLDMNRLATIGEFEASPDEIDAAGFCRADT